MDDRANILARLSSARRPAPTPGILPYDALIPPAFVRNADPVALFKTKVKAASADVISISSLSELPHALGRLLTPEDRGFPFILAVSSEIKALRWGEAGIRPSPESPSLARPQVILSEAFAAVAETGSVVFTTQGPSKITDNLFAERNVVILPVHKVVRSPEDVWRMVPKGADAPRALTFVTGPSRTGDIEETIELGAHGATAVTVILIGPTTES